MAVNVKRTDGVFSCRKLRMNNLNVKKSDLPRKKYDEGHLILELFSKYAKLTVVTVSYYFNLRINQK